MTWMRRPARNPISGQTALVTGGSGAFGNATLRVLRHMGADAIGLDLLPAEGVLACDVTDDDQVGEAVGGAIERFGGRLDTLVHYAGVGPAVDIGNSPDARVHEALDVNLLGVWRVTAAALPALVRSNGRVIITASLLACVTMPFAGAYTVAKRGLTAYADVLRAEYGLTDRVTSARLGRLVHSGHFADSPLAAGLRNRHKETP